MLLTRTHSAVGPSNYIHQMTTDWGLKVQRAQQLIAHLDAEVLRYIDEGKARIEARRDTATTNQWSLYFMMPEPPNPLWSAVVGDVLHNCRSALDIYAYQAITSRVKLSREARSKLYFPISTSRREFVGRWVQPEFPDRIVEVFTWTQPWDLPDELSRKARITLIAMNGLTTLQRMSNTDKHRGVHIATDVVLDLQYATLPEGVTAHWTWANPWPWVDGQKIGTWTVVGLHAREEPDFGHHLKLGLQERSAKARPVGPVTESLTRCLHATSHAIGILDQGLPHTF